MIMSLTLFWTINAQSGFQVSRDLLLRRGEAATATYALRSYPRGVVLELHLFLKRYFEEGLRAKTAQLPA